MIDELEKIISVTKSIFDFYQNVKKSIPEKSQVDLEQKIKELEFDFDSEKVELAEKLGYSTCKCTFPPQIMKL